MRGVLPSASRENENVLSSGSSQKNGSHLLERLLQARQRILSRPFAQECEILFPKRFSQERKLFLCPVLCARLRWVIRALRAGVTGPFCQSLCPRMSELAAFSSWMPTASVLPTEVYSCVDAENRRLRHFPRFRELREAQMRRQAESGRGGGGGQQFFFDMKAGAAPEQEEQQQGRRQGRKREWMDGNGRGKTTDPGKYPWRPRRGCTCYRYGNSSVGAKTFITTSLSCRKRLIKTSHSCAKRLLNPSRSCAKRLIKSSHSCGKRLINPSRSCAMRLKKTSRSCASALIDRRILARSALLKKLSFLRE